MWVTTSVRVWFIVRAITARVIKIRIKVRVRNNVNIRTISM